MQNLDVKDTIQRAKKTKSEIKKKLEVSISNGRNDNTNMNDKFEFDNCSANKEDAVKVIQEFEEIIKNKKSDIIWLAYYQGIIFKKFKEKERLAGMVFKFNVSKSTIMFKIALNKPKNKKLIAVSSLF